MGKKKFIDKKQATTYSLVFRSTEDADDVPQRMLIEAEKGVGVGRVDTDGLAATQDAGGNRYPPGHPLAWLQDEMRSKPLSEARRREMIELGFPDDGYDYLKHVRVLGRGTTSLETMPSASSDAASAQRAAPAEPAGEPPGPSVFMPAPEVEPPEEDVRVIDASQLTVLQAVEEEQDATVMAGGVTAFSRQKDRVGGMDKRELSELEAAMHELEEAEELGDAEGFGDLLADFVLAATDLPAQGLEQLGSEAGQSEGGESEYSEVESEDEESDSGSSVVSDDADADGSQAGTLVGRSGKPPPRPGSIASTYWREERHDRKNLLTVIDEKFEHLALEYDEEEIGDLEEQGGDIRGFADVTEFGGLLDEFLELHGESQAAHEGNVAYAAPRISQVRAEMEFHGFDDADAGIAIQRAHEALRRAEEEEAAAEDRPQRERDHGLAYLAPQERERWDCESVLSLRSNLDNHPGRISEPGRARRRAGQEAAWAAGQHPDKMGAIRLDSRGIPRGVLPTRGAGAAAESSGGVQSEEAGQDAPATASDRHRNESAEEKRARKAAVKEAQRAARAQKKELKAVFKEAKVKAQRRAATAQPQAVVKLPS